VPGELTEDEFWTRYFFRVHQIDQEEERRKAVLTGKVLSIYPSSRLLTYTTFLAGRADQDDDFSWEDEDEDAAPKAEAPLPTLTVPAPIRDKSLVAIDASGMMSPQRSDDSFDLVSSGHTSAEVFGAEPSSNRLERKPTIHVGFSHREDRGPTLGEKSFEQATSRSPDRGLRIALPTTPVPPFTLSHGRTPG
jgi:BSD domain